jgi:hypothetical protein
MTERLTADELDVLRHEVGLERVVYHIPLADLRKILTAAEECERLRAAIEKHKSILKCGGPMPVSEDHDLWEAIKWLSD